jgi:hypothetical protein
MPIRFRCDACRGKLSISRRKIGYLVECPRCAQPITVPGHDSIQEVTEFLTAVGAKLHERPVEVRAEPNSESPVLPPPPTPAPAVATRPRSRPANRPKPIVNPEDRPLFENLDVEALFEPSSRPDRANPAEATLAPPLPDSPTRQHPEDAIVLTRTAASLAVIVIVLMLMLAFAIGYVVGGAVKPG